MAREEEVAAMIAPVQHRDVEAKLKLPPGFRFHPTDEELVVHYLCTRAAGRRLPVSIIVELDLYCYNPWELPARALFGSRAWYFFTPRDRKYPNGSRPSRAAGLGYWKATGADKPIEHEGKTLGIKKALVFYHGKPRHGVKTDWIMHEYRLADTTGCKMPGNGSLRLDDWVLCRLYHKKNGWEKMQKEMGADKEMDASASHSQSFGDTLNLDLEIEDVDQLPASGEEVQEMGDLGLSTNMPLEEVREKDDLGLGTDNWLMRMNLNDMH